MKKILVLVTLLISVFGSVNAKSINDIRRNAYNAAVEATNASKNRKSAYEEYKENKKQEVEEKDDFDENCNILASVAIRYPSENNVWVKCYCYPMKDYIWYTIFYGDDNNWWINLAYDVDDEIGELFYASMNKDLSYIKAIYDNSGTETAAILLKNNSGNVVIIQDIKDPKTFAISW